jgi:Ca2+-transporting ATPase
LSARQRADWLARVEEFAQSGRKVIACARRQMPAGSTTPIEPEDGFTFTGLLAFGDPVREGVREAIGDCMAAGMRVIMVTGDHPATARAIAREIGLGGADPKVVVLAPDDDAGEALGASADVAVTERTAHFAPLLRRDCSSITKANIRIPVS